MLLTWVCHCLVLCSAARCWELPQLPLRSPAAALEDVGEASSRLCCCRTPDILIPMALCHLHLAVIVLLLTKFTKGTVVEKGPADPAQCAKSLPLLPAAPGMR